MVVHLLFSSIPHIWYVEVRISQSTSESPLDFERMSQLYFVWNPLYCCLSNSHSEWQTVQIQFSWLLQKPTDLDLHCLQRQGISGFSMTRVTVLSKVAAECSNKLILSFSEKIRLHIMWIFCKVDISVKRQVLFSVKNKKKCFKILSTVIVINI